MNEQSRVVLRCTDCPFGRRRHGDIQFFTQELTDFVFRCRRGHAYNVRRLSRAERRANPDSSEWVATRWEAGDLQEGDIGRT